MCPEWLRKIWRDMSCWLHPRDSGPEVVQGPGGVTTSPTLLGPVLVWSQRNYQRLLLAVRCLESFQGSGPATLPRGKVGVKTNELMTFNNVSVENKSKMWPETI